MKKGSQTNQTNCLFEKGDEVWDLLGVSEVESPCDLFSRKVMHSIRTEALNKHNWFETLLRSWGFAFASGSTAACALLAFVTDDSQLSQTPASLADGTTEVFNPNTVIFEENISAELIPVYSFEDVTEADTEILVAAIENPTSTTDSELVDLLF